MEPLTLVALLLGLLALVWFVLRPEDPKLPDRPTLAERTRRQQNAAAKSERPSGSDRQTA